FCCSLASPRPRAAVTRMNLRDFIDPERIALPLGGSSLADAAAELLERIEDSAAVRDREKLRRRVAEGRAEDVVVVGGRAFLVHYRGDAVAALRVALGVAPQALPRDPAADDA